MNDIGSADKFSIAGGAAIRLQVGATGNVATEDVYTLLEGYRVDTQKLDAEALLKTAAMAQQRIGKTLPSKRLAAFLAGGVGQRRSD